MSRQRDKPREQRDAARDAVAPAARAGARPDAWRGTAATLPIARIGLQAWQIAGTQFAARPLGSRN